MEMFEYNGKMYRFVCDPNSSCKHCAIAPNRVGSPDCYDINQLASEQNVYTCDDGKYHRGYFAEVDPLYMDFKKVKEMDDEHRISSDNGTQARETATDVGTERDG